MKGVDVSAVCIIPEMIFYEHLHSDLSFWHAGIINQKPELPLQSFLLCFSLWENGSPVPSTLFWEDVIR